MEKININKASMKELEKIIHIGPVRAAVIVQNRPHRDVYEVSNILGLGEKRMNDIIKEDLVTV